MEIGSELKTEYPVGAYRKSVWIIAGIIGSICFLIGFLSTVFWVLILAGLIPQPTAQEGMPFPEGPLTLLGPLLFLLTGSLALLGIVRRKKPLAYILLSIVGGVLLLLGVLMTLSTMMGTITDIVPLIGIGVSLTGLWIVLIMTHPSIRARAANQ